MATNNLHFPISRRLNASADFQALFDKPDHRLSNKAFLLLARKTTENNPRLGLVVAKKKAKRAVDRNRVKRLCREEFRLQQQQLGDIDLLILLRSYSPSTTNTRLRNDIQALFGALSKRLNNN